LLAAFAEHRVTLPRLDRADDVLSAAPMRNSETAGLLHQAESDYDTAPMSHPPRHKSSRIDLDQRTRMALALV